MRGYARFRPGVVLVGEGVSRVDRFGQCLLRPTCAAARPDLRQLNASGVDVTGLDQSLAHVGARQVIVGIGGERLGVYAMPISTRPSLRLLNPR